MLNSNRIRFAIPILLLMACLCAAWAEDFSVTTGYNDGVGTKTYNAGAGTVALDSADARWFWYLNFAQPGTYQVSARVAVSAANAGATLQVGRHVPEHNGPGSVAAANLTSTDAAANVNPQWQSLGQVWVPAPGLQFFFAKVPSRPVADAGLLHAIRVTGPGPVTVVPTWTARAAACDIYFTPTGSARRASYAEMVSRPLPVPAIGGTHTVVNMSSGYMGNNDECFNSLWASGGVLPVPLVAFGPSRVFTHEGTGSTIGLHDFNLDPTGRRKTLQISVPDGSGNTLSTFLTGEYGQCWYLGGRMRQSGTKYASASGFLENFGAFNSHVNWRSCAWGNVWAYGSQSGGANAWWANTTIRGHLRGPSPAAWPTETGVYPYGKVRQRQDMMEMVIGGLIPIAQNDTTLNNVPTTMPDLPSLNLACNLQATEVVNQAAHATVSTAYSDTVSLPQKIRDPFSTLNFTFAKVSGPAWLAVSSAGTLSGTPAAGNAGQNTLIVRATDPNAGLSGDFTVGVYVRAAAGASNAPAFQFVPTERMTVATTDDAQLILLPVVDPDGGSRTFSITAGNGGGQFGFSGDWLVKTAALTPGTSYPLTIRVTDTGSPALSATVNVTIIAVAGTNGVTEDTWFITDGTTPAEFTADPRYPDSPTQVRMLTSLSDLDTDRSTGYRLRAYLTPPTTGSYTFSFEGSSTTGELRVSTDATPANLVLRADTSGLTGAATLTAGQRYYIEALAVNGTDYDSGSITAKWTGPGIAQQEIPGTYLQPVVYSTPKLWDGTKALRTVLTGETYSENLRTKLDTLHLCRVLSYAKVSGPAWLSISTDGIVSGTPGGADAGVNTAVVRATAPGGHWDEAAFTVTVTTNTAPQFSSGTLTLPAINEGTEVAGSLASFATDTNVGALLGLGDRLTYSVVSGPAWLGVEPTGELFGTPGAPHIGANVFTVRVTDLGGASAESQLQIVVNDVPNTPIFTAAPIALSLLSGQAIAGSLSTYTFDPDAGEVLTFEKLSGPAWLVVGSNGTLSGTPQVFDVGTNTFSVKVTDSTARTSTGTLVVEVRDGQFFIYEGFDATAADPITTHTTGTGFSGPWSGTVTGAAGFNVNAASVGFGSLPVTGRSVSNGTGTAVTYTRALSQTIQAGGAGGYPEVWVSAVVSFAGTAAGQSIEVGLDSSGIAFGKSVNGPLGLKVNGAWTSATTTGGSTTSIAPTGSYLFVLRLVPNGANTDATLYVGNSTGMNLSSTANFPYKTAAVSVAGQAAFSTLRLYVNKPDPQDVNFDELRICASYAQAVPIAMTGAPAFNSNPLLKPSASVGAAYAASIVADITDPNSGDVRVFTKLSGPAWLSIGASGALSGTPQIGDVGTNDFAVKVMDAAGNSATATVRIVVQNGPHFASNPIHRLAIAAQPMTDTIAGEATGATSYALLSGPAWLSLAPGGALSGTPALADAGLNVFNIRATSANGLTDDTQLWVEVPSSALLALENFNGIAGANVTTTTGGIGWNGAWSGDTAWDFATPGLTLPGLPTSGSKITFVGVANNNLSRSLNQTITIGNAPTDHDEIWVSCLMNITTANGATQGANVRFWQGGTSVGFLGKAVNSSIGFNIGNSGAQTIAPNPGTTGTSLEGLWFLALRFTANGAQTNVTLFAARSDETFDVLNFETFPHQATANITGTFTFNKLGLLRSNTPISEMDELRVGTSYAALLGRATNPAPATYALSYTAGPNGALSGAVSQTVIAGNAGTPVTAAPNAGYLFANWSDASTANPRTDTNVTSDLAVTANFTAMAPIEAWRQLHFQSDPGGTTGPNAQDLADPNGNGITNLLEYALNGDPTGNLTALSILPTADLSANDRLQFTFIRHLDRTDITLRVQASDDLQNWTDLATSINGSAFTVTQPGATVTESGTGNTRSVTVEDIQPTHDPAHPRRFMRLKVTRP